MESTSGCELLSMMDASQGYHQIMLAPEDHKRVSFMTSDGTFCYVAMSFGLKNAGATYQRLVDKIFRLQLGKNMEVYMDDMLVKSKEAPHHVEDLEETFTVLRKYLLKLNPGKCAVGVSGGRFLGFMVTQRGIKGNPDKIKAILEMGPPTNINEVQRLMGRIVALSRFISKSIEKGLPFFKTLRKVKNIKWTEECQRAFEDLKTYLAKLPLLVKPIPGDTLYLYISSKSHIVSSVLVREEEGNQRHPFTTGSQNQYPIKASPRQTRSIRTIGQVGDRASEYDISYLPRKTIKAQALADFVSEMTETIQEEVSEEKPWLLHVDGSSIAQGSGAGIVLTTPQGDDMDFAIKFEFKASNNEAEYEALVLSMRMAQDASASHLLAYSDSQLIVKQVNGEEDNIKADSLSKLASALEDCKTRCIIVQHLPQPRITLDVQPISSNDNDWRTPIMRWIDEGHLPGNIWEATKIKTRAIRFLMQGGMLYKKSFTHPLLRCLSQDGLHVLKEIHDGCCESHVGTWALANKPLRAGYFWPTMKQDAHYLVNKCEKCQKHAALIHQPAKPLNVMLSPCPFSQWGHGHSGTISTGTQAKKISPGCH
ncbi:UNVERIFIED_CONTAM: putative protein K02A2.6 [Sesamum latifolium]|uniref:Uncharacterized protein n=1 Tax=Sesamum latifolium TaxID=2727402 RepID=A0AAW2U579_9LAMI